MPLHDYLSACIPNMKQKCACQVLKNPTNQAIQKNLQRIDELSYCKLDVATFYSQPKFFVGSKLAVKAGATICAQDLVCTASSPFQTAI